MIEPDLRKNSAVSAPVVSVAASSFRSGSLRRERVALASSPVPSQRPFWPDGAYMAVSNFGLRYEKQRVVVVRRGLTVRDGI
jgi:hypothetical protein